MKDLYALIGLPLQHSFSKRYFDAKFAQENIPAEYILRELPSIGELPQFVRGSENLRGFNVTIPYKRQVLAYLDDTDPDAAKVGAVNVVSVDRRGGVPRLKGFNSDLYGFVESIRPFIKPAQHARALVLGTGGASKAVVVGLRQLGVEPTLVSRRPPDKTSDAGVGVITYADLTDEIMDGHKVVVNATPVGTFPNTDDCPAINYSALTPEHFAFDLVYNPDQTLFLRKAAERGAATKNGLEMLHLQARKAWEIWQNEPH